MESIEHTDQDQPTTEGEHAAAGDERPAWMAQLPDDLKHSEALTGFRTIGDLGKAYLDSQGSLAGAVRLPEDDATEEEKAAFWESLGRPGTPDAYQFEPVPMPDGLEGIEDFDRAFRDMAHRAGLLDTQARGVHRFFMESFRDAWESEQQARRESHDHAVGVLRSEWGGSYERNVEFALRAAHRFGGDAMTRWLEETGAGDVPEVIRAWHAVGQAVADDSTVMGGGGEDRRERERLWDGTPVLPMRT